MRFNLKNEKKTLYLQIIANHHLEDKKKFSIGNKPVSIDIIDVECDFTAAISFDLMIKRER